MLAAIALVGCGGGGNQAAAPTGFAANQSVEAYSYTHGGYVGQAIAETDGEGNLEVTIDEAFLPHTLAGVDFESDQWTEENTATYTVRDEVNYVARWVEYEGTVYVGTTVGTTLVYVPANDEGNPAGDVNQDNLEMSIIRNEDTMSAWYDNIAEGSFATYTEFGGEATPVETTQYGSLTKRGSSYWDFGLGWQGNMDAIEDAAEEYGVRFSLDEMVRTDEGTWNLADATTAATASDFPDYFGVVQKAVARLEMQ
jgi:hypothetical protein